MARKKKVQYRAKDFSKLRGIFLEWQDAASHSGAAWVEDIESCGLVAVKSLGFLLIEDDEKIVITHGLSSDGAATECLSIPKGWIRKRKFIRV